MSNSNFPETSSEITRERALDMILASMAAEELALTHIMNAEGEKLQYLLDALEINGGKDSDINQILALNQSILGLLETVSENLLLLKGKMDKVIQILLSNDSNLPESLDTGKMIDSFDASTDSIDPHGDLQSPCLNGNDSPAGSQTVQGLTGRCLYPQMCNAMFKGANQIEIWSSGCALSWNMGNIHGKSVSRDSSLNSQIRIQTGGQFSVGFAVNVRSKTNWQCNIAISLQECTAERCRDLFIYQNRISCADTAFTAAMSGLMVDTSRSCGETYLRLNLISPDRLTVEDAMLSIVEI